MAIKLEVMPKTSREVLGRQAELKILAEKAKGVLGYSRLLQETATTSFKQALEELGFLIFTPDSVRRYQEQVTRKHGRGQSITRALIWAAALCLTSLAGWWLVIHGTWLGKIGGLFAIAMLWAVHSVITEGRKEFFWHLTPIAQYELPIPCDVLEKAIKIKGRLPQVAFFIDELKERQRPQRYSDPFLVTKLKNESYYIDVWDEPRFERIGETTIPILPREPASI